MPADRPTIVATSGGLRPGVRTERVFGPLLLHALELAGVTGRAPRLCHVGTADGDQRWFQAQFGEAGRAAGIDVCHLNVFPMPNVDDVTGLLLAQDAVWVILRIYLAHRARSISSWARQNSHSPINW